MFRVVIEKKFKEKPINLSRSVQLMFRQPFTGSIKSEHISWWKQYWLKSMNLKILQPRVGWITLVKIYREGKPSIRVITVPTSSDKRELFVMNKLYGGNQ